MKSEVNLLGEEVSTKLWNPLHFAVYYKKKELVKYFLEELRVPP